MENEFENELNDLAALRTGNLVIGGSNLFTSYILPPFITAFIKKYPLVNVKIAEANTKSLEKQLLKNANIIPNIILELDQQVTAYHVACYGMGITFISDTLIKQVPKDSRLCYYKLDFNAVTRNISFYYNKSRYITRAMSEFLKLACLQGCDRTKRVITLKSSASGCCFVIF
ncbi:LysR family transcriptional regulator substrate-binding protein [Clostridium sp. Marseille-P2415]|uniref:LysR family transcriptional regulator substrate-binding protein n=1 Tax=Clostridium sp. Marseille-P2415 TaxID=1805471 RepID=UPI0009885C5F|nr:LysR family transcriptional regulator substrate-binding protein [Clostridium sp. Marseille-P2415]